MTIGPDSKRAQVDPELLRRLDAWNDALGGRYCIDIGWRSLAAQQALYDAWISGRSSVQAAKPGTSKHNITPAQAVDLGAVSGKAANGHTTRAERVLGKQFGLTWPVGFVASGSVEFGTTEPWHVECLPGWTGTFPGSATLKLGSTGDAVRRLQQGLVAWFPSYAGALVVDGQFGAKTEAAVREFQRRSGLAVDGKVGPATWGELGRYGIR